jgi:hypothetical protein
MLCRVLLHAINLQHGTDGFISPPKEVHTVDFYPPSSAGLEPATVSPMGPVASTLTTRPLKEALNMDINRKNNLSGNKPGHSVYNKPLRYPTDSNFIHNIKVRRYI